MNSKVWRVLARLNETEERLDGAAESVGEFIDKLNEIELKIVLELATKDITPKVRQYLLRNYEQSGVGTKTQNKYYKHTGRLKQAVANSTVQLKQRGKTYSISIVLGNSSTQEMMKGGRNINVVAASLSYGAVRVPKEKRRVLDLPTGRFKVRKSSPIGQKAKKTVKNYALGKTVSDRAIDAIEGGSRNRKSFHLGGRTDNGKSVSLSGGAVVIKPFEFWKLTSSQTTSLQRLFAEAFSNRAKEVLGV